MKICVCRTDMALVGIRRYGCEQQVDNISFC